MRFFVGVENILLALHYFFKTKHRIKAAYSAKLCISTRKVWFKNAINQGKFQKASDGGGLYFIAKPARGRLGGKLITELMVNKMPYL